MSAIERLEARAAIADLVHGYALAVRRDRPEDIEVLFAPNGTFEVREGAPDRDEALTRTLFESPRDLVAFLLSTKGQPHPVPLIHNLMIVVDGDVAQASSLMVAPILGTDRQVMGEYADSFVRLNGRWRFQSRIYTLFRNGISS
jgi:hypothetical protein